MTSAPDAFTTEDLQVLFGVPSNEIMGCHIHKLAQVVNLYHFPFPFSSFAWFWEMDPIFRFWGRLFTLPRSTWVRRQRLYPQGPSCRVWRQRTQRIRRTLSQPWMRPTLPRKRWGSCLTTWGVERQLNLEKDEQLQAAKERVKAVAAKSVESFQQTDECNTVLFNWYYKGFKLLRWYSLSTPLE